MERKRGNRYSGVWGIRVSVFEIAMLVCFGAAWPVSIYKSLKSRQVAGKSLPFLVIVLVGYAAGVLHKLIFHYDLVIFLYVLNALMVTIDIVLYLRNRMYHVRRSILEAGGAENKKGSA
jgi:uncharacterized membrane protein YbjE (DUF340 family)